MERKKMGRVLYAIIAFAIVTTGRYCFGEDFTLEQENVLETQGYLPTSTTGAIIKHTFFTLSYSEYHKQAEWVAYEVTRERLSFGEEERGHFAADPVLGKKAVTPKDYSRMGYDRGHLAAAADMNFSDTAMSECFYMTNMSPQEPGFNRGVWKQLEERVRMWGFAFGHLYVVTGPVLTERAKKRFPKSKKYVAVPRSFYKVVLDYTSTTPKAIALLLKNEESDAPLRDFVISINELEELTEIDFFPNLPDEEEEMLESQSDIEAWGLNRVFRTNFVDSLALDSMALDTMN